MRVFSLIVLLGLAAPLQAGPWQQLCHWVWQRLSPQAREASRFLHHQQLDIVEEVKAFTRLVNVAGLDPASFSNIAPELRLAHARSAVIKKHGRDSVRRFLSEMIASDPTYESAVMQALERIDRQNIKLRWSSNFPYRNDRRIYLDVVALGHRHPIAALLTTLSHELAHQVIVARPGPGESQAAFEQRYLEILMVDEQHACHGAISAAIEIQTNFGLNPIGFLSGISLAVYRARSTGRKGELQSSDMETIRRWDNGIYVDGWLRYLGERWEQVKHSPGE